MRIAKCKLSTLSFMMFIGVASAWSQTPTSPPSAAPPATPAAARAKSCVAEEHRQFDFWVGDWDVVTPDGKPAGTNLIKLILGGCVLHENWNGRGGLAGQSFNAYDAKRKRWHQTWVDGQGTVLTLDGRFANGAMGLSDKDTPGKADANAINEITWTPMPDGAVRQLWRTSQDGGKTWAVAFDGKYVRSARVQPQLTAK